MKARFGGGSGDYRSPGERAKEGGEVLRLRVSVEEDRADVAEQAGIIGKPACGVEGRGHPVGMGKVHPAKAGSYAIGPAERTGDTDRAAGV